MPTRLQGAYYVATGAWSLAHYPSFELVSGSKRDRWLVQSVGLLTVATGIGLLRHGDSTVADDLADASAAAFAVADVLAVRSGQRWVYLLDAVLECLFIATRHSANTHRAGAES